MTPARTASKSWPRARAIAGRARVTRARRSVPDVRAAVRLERHAEQIDCDQRRAQIEGVYTGAMYTDDLNTVAVTANGQRGRMPGHVVWNVAIGYSPTDALEVYGTVKNAADRTYVVDMTRGLLPGSPRLVQLGFAARF